jgi:acetoin utilization deacetylase AcuC-like enzyme
MRDIKIIFSPKCLQFEAKGHPESPQRVKSAYEYLKEKGFEFIEPRPAAEEDILTAHSKELVEKIKNLEFFDADTSALEGIYEYARLSAGGAITAMEEALKGNPAFSLMRPPGHHAKKDTLGGFCYFNNIAIAVLKALSQRDKAAILDIDCHHGNGTQDIFLGRKDVLYASLHQAPLYPGTGLTSLGNCLNYPLRPLTQERGYLKTLQSAIDEIKKFGSPAILAVSAGFDTYKKDPLTQMALEIDSYRKIGELIANTKLPCFCVLEGGYSQDLKYCVYEFIRGLGG